MKLGIAIQETWSFFEEIYTDLANHYETNLFRRRSLNLPFFYTRINRYLFHRDLRTFMHDNDVVLFEWASELLATATHLPKVCGIITRLHRYEMYEWVDRINWNSVDKIILVSEAKKREFCDRFPDQASKVVIAYEGVDLNKFQMRYKLFNGDIGILCHITPRKRVYELILAFYQLVKDGYNFHLHIGGGLNLAYGDYYQAINELIRKLDLKNKVTLYGNVTETADWYHNIDIFISNSYSEGLQVAPLEAMSSGCYCLSHRWDGAEEMLPEYNLFFTDRELQEKIIAFCELSEEEKNRSKKYMREIACEKFDINHTKAQFRQAIEDVGEREFVN